MISFLGPEPSRNHAIITEQDQARAKRLKVDQFISGMSYQRVHLDHELDDRTDRIRCEEGEEVCDVCAEDDRMAEHTAALQQEYVAEREREARR